MSVSNLAIVFSPTLGISIEIVSLMIEKQEKLFSEENSSNNNNNNNHSSHNSHSNENDDNLLEEF